MRAAATPPLTAPVGAARRVSRRRLLGLAAAAAASPLLGPLRSLRLDAAAHRDVRFRLLNLETSRHGLRCAEDPSPGPVTTIESLRRGRLDVGIVPSDVLADAVAGRELFAARGPATDLRLLFAGPDELLTVVARAALGIRTMEETRGTRINIGTPGSRQRLALDRVTAALGLGRSAFADVRELAAAEQHRAFCLEQLDVIVYSVGHPSSVIHDVTRTCHRALVDVSGPAIDRMLSEHREYERA